MKKFKRFLRDWWLLTAIVGIGVLFTLFHIAGFRIAPGLSIERVGTVVIENVPQTASVYVDEMYNRKSGGGTERVDLLPGNHQVIVSLPNSQPWSEIVSITSDTETIVNPIIIPVKVGRTVLPAPETQTAAALISKTHLPTLAAPLMMADGCAQVYVVGNRIMADATTTPSCTPPPYLCSEGTCGTTVIFSPVEPMHTVIAYPNRQDMLIVSVGGTLFVLELDPRTPEFFAPLFSGTTPRAAVDETGRVIVSSGLKFYTLDL